MENLNDEMKEQIDQLKQVIDYLANGSVEQKQGALEIILPYSGTQETRKLFEHTEISKELLRQLYTISDQNKKIITDLTKNRILTLKCLINLSQDLFFIEQMCKLNISQRIYDILKENVKQDLKNVELTDNQISNSTQMNFAEGTFNLADRINIVDPVSGKIIDQENLQEQTIEHCFLLISNLTTVDVGQTHILGLDDTSGSGKFKFIIVESIFGMFCYFSKNTAFDFVSNIMANLACQKEGRIFMINHKYIDAISLQMISKPLNSHRRKYLIQCIRNILFEYQDFEQNFLELNIPRTLCKVLIDEQGLTDKLPESWQKYKSRVEKNIDQIDMMNTSQLLDGLVLLANSDGLLKIMKKIQLESLIQLIQLPKGDEWEEARLRITVLENQLATADQIDSNQQTNDEEQLPQLQDQ